jgi:hypothetical protein
MTKYLFFVLTAFLLIQASFQKHTCVHDSMDKHPLETFPHEEVDPETAGGRILATTYGPLRIYLDYTYLKATAATATYIKTKLLPAAVSYFSTTLKVPQLSKLSVAANRASICGLAIPAIYKNGGVQADIVLFVTGQSTSESWVAWAMACSLLSGTNRPIFGQINFNYNSVSPATGVAFEGDLMSTLHEITHALGFSADLFPSFLTKPTIKTKTVNGNTVSYLNVEPLTTRLRTYFNCPTLAGAYMEQQGGSGSAGSHFERRIFNNEYMTASEINDARITQFTLALLESSGWYQVNYNMAEPFFWGKGKGCAFLDGTCVSSTTKKANFNEFCTTIGSYGCSFHGRAGGFCGNTGLFSNAALDKDFNYWGDNRVVNDNFADNCPYINAYSNVDCEDTNSAARAVIKGESYGIGSKCFMGTLYPTGGLSRQYQYCLKYNCEKQTSGKYYLRMYFGTNSAVCTAAGNLKVAGYSGTITCPDPQEYCTTVGIKYCKRGCLGRGTCGSDAKCKCFTGYTGDDCSTKVTVVEIERKIVAPPFDVRDILPGN